MRPGTPSFLMVARPENWRDRRGGGLRMSIRPPSIRSFGLTGVGGAVHYLLRPRAADGAPGVPTRPRAQRSASTRSRDTGLSPAGTDRGAGDSGFYAHDQPARPQAT